MALPGETLASGAPPTCEDCGVTVELGVYRSAAGWYVGTYCDCGPYSRESEYAGTEEEAQGWLENWDDLNALYGR